MNMQTSPRRILSIGSGAVAMAAALTFATPTLGADCAGHDVLVDVMSETTDLGGGHLLIVARSYSILITDSPDNPYNLMSGYCDGSSHIAPDGTFSGSGHCARKDADGDTMSLTWDFQPGAEKGTWKTLTGTGKFANDTSSGWWQPVLGDPPMSASVWGGDCKM